MKGTLLSILTLIIFCSAGFAQEGEAWKWSHQQPQGNTLRWVKMWDTNNWYAVGYGGTFMKTTDGGATWDFNHKAGMPDPLTDIYESIYDATFWDMNNGIIVGGGGMTARTTDGGETWTATLAGTASTTWYDVDYLSSTVAYAAGTSSGRLAKTTDGGLTWELNTILTSATYYGVHAIDQDTIIVSSSGGNIRRTTDAGLTWATISTGTSVTLYALNFVDANTGWVAGSSASARFTTDAGLTWTSANTGIPSTTIYNIDFHASTIYLTGNAFDIYSSTDMGTTWVPISFLAPVANQPWTSTYYSTSFYLDNFVTVGAAGLINSKIGAGTPVAHTLYMKAGTLYDVWAESTTGKVIAVGSPGNTTSFDQIMYSTDGGESWSIATTSDAPQANAVQYFSEDEIEANSSTFRAIDMVSSNVGFIAGQNGSFYKTTNGGVFWDSVGTTAGTIYFYDVDFIDANTGWVVGATGNCWKTTDGGATWTQQTTAITTTIYGIDMVDANYGWICGSSGNVNITTDGGTTWTAQTSGNGTSTIYGVAAVDMNTAYVAGASGKISRTTDAGVTWELLTMPTQISTSTFYAIDFRGAYGVASASVGKIAATSDGGATWWYANNNGSTTYGVRIAVQGTDTTSVFSVGSIGGVHKNSTFVVPVELTSFTSAVSGNTVTLNWITATEKNNSGFSVERKTETTEFETVGFVSGNGTTTKISNYSYSDKVETGKYIYRLKQIDFDGSFAYSSEIEAEIELPTVFALEQNYPNPFNPSTIIRYSVPVDGFVSLSIYNALGEKVASLVNQQVTAGVYEVDFNASSFASGIYFYRLDAGNFVSIKKMMLLK